MNRSPPPHPQDPQEEERPPCKINEREGAVRYRALDRYLPPREEDHNPLYTRNYIPGSFLSIQRSKACTGLKDFRERHYYELFPSGVHKFEYAGLYFSFCFIFSV